MRNHFISTMIAIIFAAIVCIAILCLRDCGRETRWDGYHVIETIDGHEYIRNYVKGGATYTHLASCRYCKKEGRR